MPDQPWVNLSRDDSANYEKNNHNGQPPDPLFRPWGSDDRLKQHLNGSRVELHTDYFVNWTVQPPPTPVRIRCAMCAEHIHTSIGDVPDADQIHASPGYWLERDGVRFKNAQVTGTELKRTEHVLIHADGSEMIRLALWSRRQVNTVKNGIEWQWGDFEFECIDDLPFSGYASLLDSGIEMATALTGALTDAGLVPGGRPPVILMGGLLSLLAQAGSLREPAFRLDSGAGEHHIVLFEKSASAAEVEVGRQRLSVVEGKGIIQAGGTFRHPIG